MENTISPRYLMKLIPEIEESLLNTYKTYENVRIYLEKWESRVKEFRIFEVADCNLISVFPVIGWWRERNKLKKFNNKGRYSLIISLETPVENIQLYSAVQAMIQVPIEIQTI